MPTMRRWLTVFMAIATAALLGAVAPAPAVTAADTPIGPLGATLRVQNGDLIADVTVLSVEPSEIPPGFGYPPRPPRHQVWKAKVAVQAIQVPNPHQIGSTFVFNGVTPTGDAYEPRKTDAPEALQFALLDAPNGSAVGGFVYWDCYRDLVSHVVLSDKRTGMRLAQWNV